MSELRHKPSASGRNCGRADAALGTNLGAMNNDRPSPNAELQRSFEPLRVIFALGALLLGLIASLPY